MPGPDCVKLLADWHNQIPCSRVIANAFLNTRSVQHTTWGEALTDDVATDEGEILHFDFSYRAIGGIGVDAPVRGGNGKRQKMELAYVLGLVLGTQGCILSSIVCSTEKWDHIADVFRMAMQKAKVPPTQIWVDDYRKWGLKLKALVADEFTDRAGEPVQVGQD